MAVFLLKIFKYFLLITTLITFVSSVYLLTACLLQIYGLEINSHHVRVLFFLVSDQQLGLGGDLSTYLLLTMAIVLSFFSFLGCCGILTSNYCMLKSFAAIQLTIVIAIIVSNIVLQGVWRAFQPTIRDQLMKSLVNYQSLDNNTSTIDEVQRELKCCGVDSIDDWVRAGKYIPSSCCPIQVKRCDRDSAFSLSCMTLLDKSRVLKLLVLDGFVLLIPLMIALGTCCLANSLQKKDYQRV